VGHEIEAACVAASDIVAAEVNPIQCRVPHGPQTCKQITTTAAKVSNSRILSGWQQWMNCGVEVACETWRSMLPGSRRSHPSGRVDVIQLFPYCGDSRRSLPFHTVTMLTDERPIARTGWPAYLWDTHSQRGNRQGLHYTLRSN
jgi:hypothetical protein